MQVLLGLFLILTTLCALAQQSSSSAPSSALPDAPSSSAQRPSSDASILRPTQFLNFATPNAVRSSALVFVGGTSMPSLRQPLNESTPGTCPRAASKSDSGGWITSLLSVTSKGPHYCALGEGGFWRRGTYAMGRAFAAHSNDGAKSFNASDLFARNSTGFAYGAYPSYAYQYDAGQRMATRYATAVGRDVLKNLFREFMPDFSTHVLKRRP